MAMQEKTNSMPATARNQGTKAMSNVQRVGILACGDAIAFLVFAAIGRGSHGEASGLAAIPQIVVTAAPFAAGWFIVSPFIGAYRREIVANPRKMAVRTILAWLLSWPVALTFRGIFVNHGVPPFSFAMITLIFNTLILLLWRWPYALNNSLRKP